MMVCPSAIATCSLVADALNSIVRERCFVTYDMILATRFVRGGLACDHNDVFPNVITTRHLRDVTQGGAMHGVAGLQIAIADRYNHHVKHAINSKHTRNTPYTHFSKSQSPTVTIIMSNTL